MHHYQRYSNVAFYIIIQSVKVSKYSADTIVIKRYLFEHTSSDPVKAWIPNHRFPYFSLDYPGTLKTLTLIHGPLQIDYLYAVTNLEKSIWICSQNIWHV